MFVGNPDEKSCHCGVGNDNSTVCANAREFAVRKGRMKSAMADGMNLFSRAAAPAFGHRVMLFGAATDRPATKPADRSRRFGHSPIAGVATALPVRHR